MNNAQKHYHRELVARKYEKKEGLLSLLETWEPLECDSKKNMLYVSELRRRIRSIENQLLNMGEP